MLLVVLGHIGVNDNFGSSYLFKWIYAFHMPLFFWISGFLFNGGSCFRKFLSKKAKRLLVPLVVLTSIVYYPKVLLSDFAVRRADGSFFGFISSFIYPETNPIQLLWFLNVLFGTYVLAWIIDNVIKSKSTGWLLGGGINSRFILYITRCENIRHIKNPISFSVFCDRGLEPEIL